MEKVKADMLRSIFFEKKMKANVLSPQALQQDVLDFDAIMQDQRYSDIHIVSEPTPSDSRARGDESGLGKQSMGSALIKEVQGMESSTRNSFDRAFEIMREFEHPVDKLPNDVASMAKESIKTMQKVTYVQYLLNTGHARLHVALKMAHLISEGVRTLYRQQG